MGGYLIGDDTCAHIFFVGQCKVLLWGDVAQHGRAQPADLRRTDSRSDMVVARCNVRNQRAERVERRIVAFLYLAFHILLNLVHGHVSGSFDKSLHVLCPGAEHKLAHGIEFGKLRFVVGIVRRAGTQAVAQGNGYIVLRQYIADVVKMFVQETFAVVHQTPFAHDASAATHDAAQTLVGQVYVVAADTSVYGEVVHALFALFNQGIAVELPREVFHFAVHFLQCLINGNRTYGNRTVADNPFAGFVDIFSGR